jgi:hypothetical protein
MTELVVQAVAEDAVFKIKEEARFLWKPMF